MTPEGLVKKATRALLSEFNIQEAKDVGRAGTFDGWYFWAASNGRGVKGVPDAIGFYKGLFFGIEVKAPGEEPEGFQALQIKSIRNSGGPCFVVDGEHSLRLVRSWLNKVRRGW